MSEMMLPEIVLNWIDGAEKGAADGSLFNNLSPATGKLLCQAVGSRQADVEKAVASARNAYPAWSGMTPVQRGDILMAVARALRQNADTMAAIVATETGMAPSAALGETGGAIAQAEFMAGEGRRLYGRTHARDFGPLALKTCREEYVLARAQGVVPPTAAAIEAAHRALGLALAGCNGFITDAGGSGGPGAAGGRGPVRNESTSQWQSKQSRPTTRVTRRTPSRISTARSCST